MEESAAQDGQLPLHYAAEKGASLNVMKLLFEASPEAVNAADEARSSAHTAPPTLRPQLLVPLLLFLCVSSFNRPATPVLCATRLATRRRKSCPCTTLPPRAHRSM